MLQVKGMGLVEFVFPLGLFVAEDACDVPPPNHPHPAAVPEGPVFIEVTPQGEPVGTVL